MSIDMKTKTKSPWILHVLQYAKDNNLKYNEALRDPNLKIGYVKVERVKTKSSPVMELNRNYDKVEPVMKVKKQRKTKDDILGSSSVMVVETKPMIMTESGNLEMKIEPKKVKVKRSKKELMM